MKKELIIPIYVDTNALLDLLASIEDGFSMVEKVTSRETHGRSTDHSVEGGGGTEFGIPNVLSLLKIKLSGSTNSRNSQEKTAETQAERFHTYGSLLTRLRAHLNDNELVVRVDGGLDEWWPKIHPSTFIELRGVFRPNPLADALKAMDKVASLSSSMSSLASPPNLDKQRQPSPKSRPDPLAPIRKVANDVITDIEEENIRLFVVDTIGDSSIRAVTLLVLDYLRDRSMTEIAHKEFTLLGKVVRKLDRGSEEKVKLLRGTGMGSFGKKTLDQFVEAFSNMGDLEFPKPEVEIDGPALEIVPIAVFV